MSETLVHKAKVRERLEQIQAELELRYKTAYERWRNEADQYASGECTGYDIAEQLIGKMIKEYER